MIDRVSPLCLLKIEPIQRIGGSPKAIPLDPDRLRQDGMTMPL